MTEAKSTKGEDIKKENVTPTGKPAFVNPIKIGIDEHEQNGVTVPKSAPIEFAPTPLCLDKIRFVLSGEKNDWIYDAIKIKTDNKIIIFITSYTKKDRLSKSIVSLSNLNISPKNHLTPSSSHCIFKS
jgi:hypothetical protein